MFSKDNLASIISSENVSSADQVLNEYREDFSFTNPMKPRLVVKAKKASDIEKIVKLANQTKTPLIPVSSGPPHFKGDTVPTVPESVIVDLSGMKEIFRVDRKDRVALCEPGVTFGELIAAVKKEGLRLNMPLLPRCNKSVVGSMLEREPVIMPKYHWDISDPIACMEVIFGTGDLFRTGEAAGPGTLEEQWASGGSQKEAAGPAQVSWHRLIQGAQGTMGIVAWSSLRCELIPEIEEPFWVGSENLDKVMEMVRDLIVMRLVNECLILNNTDLAAIVTHNYADFQKVKDSLPHWLLFFNIAGYEYFPDERVAYQIADMQGVARKAGIEAHKSLANISARDFLELIKNPSVEPYWKLRHKGNCQDIFFITNSNQLTKLVNVMTKVVLEEGYPVTEMGTYIQPIVQGVNYHCEFNLPFSSENKVEIMRVKKIVTRATKELMSQGAFFSRPYGGDTSLIMNRDAGTVFALKKVKGILDPNGVMNPGKLCF